MVLWLSSGIEVAKEYQSLFIRKGKRSKTPSCKSDYYYVLKEEGKFYVPEIRKTFHIDYLKKKGKSPLKFNDSSTIYLDADKIKFPVILRTRKRGDRFYPFGMEGERKLKDFFIDEKVPLKERNKIPILVTEAGKILWIVGYRRSNLGIINQKTSKIIRIRF